MKKNPYHYLCCPVCKKKLRKFTCCFCRRAYPIRNGIPILVDLEKLPKHLRDQITYFEKEDETRSKGFVSEPWQERYVKNFLTYGKPKPGGLIIDNATGSGYMAIELAKRGFFVIATDLTLKELLKLKANLRNLGLEKRVLLVCANSEELPVKTAVADGMAANAILEHLPHETKAASDMTRVLKRGAPLMLAMPIRLLFVWPFLWPVNRLHDKRIGHLRRYSRSRILSLFGTFHEIRTYYTGSLFKVVCLALKMHELGEYLDENLERVAYGTSNVVSILRKA